MFWFIIGAIFILALSWLIHRATRGTPFEQKRGCTPNISKLKYLEETDVDKMVEKPKGIY